MRKRVLVTGGNGFIGTNLVRSLSDQHEVLSYDSSSPRDPALGDHWVEGSILDQEALENAYADFSPTHIVHLAARTDLHGKSLSDYDANTEGVRSVIEVGERSGLDLHTIYASSRLVFRIGHQPEHDFDYLSSTPYGESKIEGELIVRELASRAGTWTIVRPTSIWGPWFGTPYRDFFDTVAARRYVSTRTHDVEKSFGYVGNAVHEICAIMAQDPRITNGQVYWLADYPPTLVSAWANEVARQLGVSEPVTVPYAVLRTAALVGDAMKRLGVNEPPLTSFRLKNLTTRMVYETKTTERLAGKLPFSMVEGVKLTVEWIREQDAVTWPNGKDVPR